jgi:F-type H+/Na+-transporting ATPase subunit alpha
VSVPAQIAVLLALTAALFDSIPLDKMADAEHTVHKAAVYIPAEVCARLDMADKLSDEDRETIVAIARNALESFMSGTDSNSKTGRTTVESASAPEARLRS